MIELIDGRGVGSGKSYYVASRLMAHAAAGGVCYYVNTFELMPEPWMMHTGKRGCGLVEAVRRKFGVEIDFAAQFHSITMDQAWRLHETTPPGTDDSPLLIVMDEAQRILNARDWADTKKRGLFEWMCESRHDNNDLIFITQAAENIDKQIRRLLTYRLKIKNLHKMPLMGIKFPFRMFLLKRYDGDSTVEIDKSYLPHDPLVFASYRSKSMGGSHQRLGAAVGRVKVKKTKGKRMIKTLLYLLVALVIGGGIYIYSNREGMKRALDTSTPTLPATVDVEAEQRGTSQVDSNTAGLWETVEEKFRGLTTGDGPATLRTDRGEYVVGSMSPRGLVEAVDVQARVAKVATPAGRMLFVMAVDVGGRVDAVKFQPAGDFPAAPAYQTPPPAFRGESIGLRPLGDRESARISGGLATPLPSNRRQARR